MAYGGAISRAERNAIDMVAVRRVLAGQRGELTRAEHNRVYLELVESFAATPPQSPVVDGRRVSDPRYAAAAVGLGKTPKYVSGYVSRLRSRIEARGGALYPVARDERTHSSKGHELTPDNTYVPPGLPNSRRCRTCQRITQGKPRNVEVRREYDRWRRNRRRRG